MGKKIEDNGDFSATAVIKEKNAMVKGVLKGVRLVETKFGKKPIFSLAVIDAECKFTKGKGEEAFPAEGELIDIFAPTRLAKQLSKVENGQVVTIRYIGLGRNTRGNPPHTFDVEVD